MMMMMMIIIIIIIIIMCDLEKMPLATGNEKTHKNIGQDNRSPWLTATFFAYQNNHKHCHYHQTVT